VGARVQLNHGGMRQLLNDPGVEAHLRALAGPVAARAAATAPVDEGTWAASFRVVAAHTDRVVVRIISTDPKGAIKEARFRTLTKALGGSR
jgi:hypothetical protein